MSKFTKIETGIDELYILEPTVFGDERGFFMESFNSVEFKKLNLDTAFVQDNHSKSKKGVLRGLHLQTKHSQGKLLRVISGEIYDVVVDLREGSSTYGKWYGIILSEKNKKMLYIPKGFAHGFLTISEYAECEYKCSDIYAPEYELGILWNDKDLSIDWKLEDFSIKKEDLIFSNKDKNNITFKEYENLKKSEKVLLLGGDGQLGRAFQKFFKNKNIAYISKNHEELDICNIIEIEKVVKEMCISTIINCAAYNNVDLAEVEETKKVYEINCIAPGKIAKFCSENGVKFISYSTDFVFDGEKNTPYTEEDVENPISIYGKSKLDGEQEILKYKGSLIIRTSWVFGEGKNFITQLLQWAKEKSELAIVDDQISSPTYSEDIAKFTWYLYELDGKGIYNFSNNGEASKYDQAKYVLEKINWQGKLLRAKSSEFNLKAKRPKYSKLDSYKVEKETGKKIPHWKDGIDRYMKEMSFDE